MEPILRFPEAAVTPRYRIDLLGPFAIYRNGTPIGTGAWRPRVLTLLRLLAVAPGLRRPRDEVIDLLWPDSRLEAGAANLRDLARLLRRALGAGSSPVLLEHGWVALNTVYRWEVDLARFEELAHEAGDDLARLEAAASLVQGQPLPDDRYADWAAPVRDGVERRWRQLCLQLIERHRAEGAGERALAWAEHLLQYDPLDEVALRHVLLLLDELGQRPEAQRRYQQFADRLARELDVSVSPETEALAEQIRREVRGGGGEAADPGQTTSQGPPPIPATNLPIQATSFIGRGKELAVLGALLRRDDVRLVTLTGPGGVGKTRLALQLAAGLLDRYADGVWLVELASLADPTLVPQSVAAALGLREQPGRPLAETLLEALRTRQTLLVLDNCEHLLDACMWLASALVRNCSRLQVLVTSREPLGLAGETCWRVPSLALPGAHEVPFPELLAACEAVQLFRDRAQAAQPRFRLSEANAPAVARICARLDGIPLALELAAARVRALGVADLAARLDQRFRLLTGGSRAAPARQQTLRAAVDWSYDLLDEGERTLFARLSVFAGAWTLEAAEAMCAGEGLVGEEVLDLLVRLADKSLVVVEADGEVTRYRLLETIREYARVRLEASGKASDQRAATHARHCDYYATFLAHREVAIKGGAQDPVLTEIEGEIDNVRAAWQWAAAHGRGREIGRAVESLCLFYSLRGWFAEGEEALGRAAESLARGAAGRRKPAGHRRGARPGAGVAGPLLPLAGPLRALGRAAGRESGRIAALRRRAGPGPVPGHAGQQRGHPGRLCRGPAALPGQPGTV